MPEAKNKEVISVRDGFAIITLSRPAAINGANVSQITMREPLVRDQRAVSNIGTDEARELALMSNLCELSPEDLDGLPLKDYRRLQTALVGFIG